MGERSALEIRDFRLALWVRLFDSLGMQMLGVTVAWQIFHLTRDPLLLGAIGLSEGLPFMAGALWAGHQADRREKSGMIVAAQACILAGVLALWLLSLSASPRLALVYACLAWGGFCRSFYWAAMTTYIQMAVPREIFPRAAAWSTGVLHACSIVGPALGGLAYGLWGAGAAYGCTAVCFLATVACAGRLSPMPAPRAREASGAGLEGFLSGIRFVLSRRVMLAAMSLDMFGVLFGGVEGVLPIFAARLGHGPAGLGILQAAPAAGALLSSLYLTRRSPSSDTGRAFLRCVTVFGLCMIDFAFSRSFPFSCLLLAASGAADCVGMVLRSSIYQTLTPDELRGRVSAVNGIFIRSSNEIGVFESGLAARLLGLVPSVVFGGCMTLVSVGVALWAAPDLRSFRLESARPRA